MFVLSVLYFIVIILLCHYLQDLKEPLAKQAALIYYLLRKVFGIKFPIALRMKTYKRNSLLNFRQYRMLFLFMIVYIRPISYIIFRIRYLLLPNSNNTSDSWLHTDASKLRTIRHFLINHICQCLPFFQVLTI